jgi:uncharacterized protein (TIGR02246 family)
MRPVSVIPLLLLGSLTLGPAAASAQHDHARDSLRSAPSSAQEQVRATLEALFRAAERGDLAALDTLYAGDRLTVIEGAGINRGWTDYRDHHLAPELKEFQDFQYRPTEIESHVSGDLAWAIFRYTLTARVGERAIDHVGRGTAVLERRDGRWVVRHTHTASRPRRLSDPA